MYWIVLYISPFYLFRCIYKPLFPAPTFVIHNTMLDQH